MKKETELSFGFAGETVKQLITLSTAVIALTVTFVHDLFKNVTPAAEGLLVASWVSFAVSMILGIMSLMTITGALTKAEPDVYAGNTRVVVGLQVIAFVLGMVLVIAFGAVQLTSGSADTSHDKYVVGIGVAWLLG